MPSSRRALLQSILRSQPSSCCALYTAPVEHFSRRSTHLSRTAIDLSSIFMAQTTLVLVHGAWHPPSAWDAFLPALQPLGLRTSIVSLPSVNGQIKDYKQGEDTAAVRDAIVKELDAGHDVAVVAHSYGGFPTAEAVQGLAKSDRNGKSGVVKLIYLAAFAIPKGATMLDGVGGEPLEWWNLKVRFFLEASRANRLC